MSVGLIGVIVLLQEGDFQVSPGGTVLVIAGPLFWAFGAVWGERLEMPKGFVAPAAQLLTTGVVMLFVSPIMGERAVEMPGTVAWLALVYLIVMGSIIAYSAYVYLLRTVRPVLATSYAYVNPVVAVFLGLTLGAEIISGPIFVALPLTLAAVGLTATVRRRTKFSSSSLISDRPEPLEEAV